MATGLTDKTVALPGGHRIESENVRRMLAVPSAGIVLYRRPAPSSFSVSAWKSSK